MIPQENSHTQKKIKIENSHLVICEGKDDKIFLETFFASLLQKHTIFSKFQIFESNGVSKLKKVLKLILNAEGNKDIKSIIIVRDANGNFASACESVKNIFSELKLPTPLAPNSPISIENNFITAFLIFPSCDGTPKNGSLEDLCIKIINNNTDILEIAKTAVDNSNKINVLSHKSKNILHTFLSLTNDFVSLKLGEATKHNAFNFESEDIKCLINFFIDIYAKSENNCNR
jgi:hypothetical protein